MSARLSSRQTAPSLGVVDVSPALRGRLTVTDHIVESLRNAIQSGQLADGMELSQVGLARHFGVSRVPVREALRALEAQGWISAPTNQRAFVQALSPSEVAEIFDLRMLIEVELLGLAIPRVTKEIISDLSARCDAMDAIEDHSIWVAENQAFHRALLAPSQAPFRVRLVETLTAQVERYLRLHHAGSNRQREAGLEHRAIVRAVADKDLRVSKQLLRKHIQSTGAAILAAFKNPARSGD